MAQVSIGDLSQSFLFRRQNFALKAEQHQLTTELSTGVTRDVAARLSGDVAPLSGIETTLSRLKGYDTVTKDAAFFAQTMQAALQHIDGLSTESSQSLLVAVSSNLNHRVDASANDARRQLETVVSTLNTRLSDRSIFAGTAISNAAVADADTMLAALGTAAAGAQTAGEVEIAVTAWFASPTGYAATGYLGGPPLQAWNVAPGESASADFTASDPGIRDTLASFAMAALLDTGILADKPGERTKLAQTAGVKLLESQTSRAAMAARLGTAEAHIDTAATRNSAESASLQIARNELISVDPYETAARLEETQTRLETMYAVLARMSRLSLVDFLR